MYVTQSGGVGRYTEETPMIMSCITTNNFRYTLHPCNSFQGTLGVAQSESALLYTILCPVGEYFTGSKRAVSLYADPSCIRAWPGGCGDAKLGSNYGPTIAVLRKAAARGRQQVLWLYGPDNQVTEIGTMNVFMFYINDRGGKPIAEGVDCVKIIEF